MEEQKPKEKMKVNLLQFGKANLNGKVYLAEEFNFPKVVTIIYATKNEVGMTFNEEVGSASLTKTNEGLDAEITFFSGAPHSKRAEELVVNDGHSIVASGIGHVDADGYVREYTMQKCVITNDPSNIY